ncbi:MAG: Fis family transcriptional regulator [Hydrogenimonas sp.]|nr:Fis family transcriptional regulator [Hydrogenimonas sp.]
METINFIAESKPLKEALKSANLLKSLQFNTLISGEYGTGRHTLASYMMPDAAVINGSDVDLYTHIENSDQIIIEDIDRVDSLSRVLQSVSKHKTKVIAITEDPSSIGPIISLFSVRIELPPLSERREDILPLAMKFAKEAEVMFGEKGAKDFIPDIESVDLSRNAFSLRRSIFLQYFAENMVSEELMMLNQAYLLKRMDDSEDIYRRELFLYEVPLIRAGMKRYKSQLKMSQAFGLNRNTLRKKITEWKEYL